jgi:hypothetical protein
MSSENSAELPLWVQDRNTVLDHDKGVKWRKGEKPDYYPYRPIFTQRKSI